MNTVDPLAAAYIKVSELYNENQELKNKIKELEADKKQPLILQDFIELYEELSMMQLWDWLMYNDYISRVEEQEEMR